MQPLKGSVGRTLTVGNNFYISISPDSEEEADRLFNGLSAGGQVIMPLHKAFWGAYFRNAYRQVWNSMDGKL
jgi:PhnB protein